MPPGPVSLGGMRPRQTFLLLAAFVAAGVAIWGPPTPGGEDSVPAAPTRAASSASSTSARKSRSFAATDF